MPPRAAVRRTGDRTVAAGKQDQILQAALELFTERTFAGCAVPLVAERAGVATGTIYRYFPSKEALLNAVYQQWKGELKRRLVDGRGDAGDVAAASARDEFHHWWSTLAAFVLEQPTAFEFLELHHHEPYLDEASHLVALEVEASALAFTMRGQEEGVLRTDITPQVVIALVYGALTGIFRAMRLHPELFTADDLAHAEQAAWDMVRLHGADPAPTPAPPPRPRTTATTAPTTTTRRKPR